MDVAGTEYMNKIKEAVIFLIDCQPDLFQQIEGEDRN